MAAHHQITATWPGLASVAIAAALWQSGTFTPWHSSSQNGQTTRETRTRHLTRPLKPSSLPDESYSARCATGMAREEIAWIIDDFKAAQLDPARNATTRDQCLTHRRSQHRWYLEALGDALSLSSVQAAEARRRLSQNFEQAASMFIESLGRSHAMRSAEETCIDTFENQTIRDFVSAGHWLFDPSIPALPWDLCDLTPKQETITWKHWHDQPSDPDDPENSTNPNFLLPKPDCVGILSVRHLAPASLMPANQILPFLTNQNFIEASNPLETLTDISAIELIAQIRALHPSQLKILLLLKPAMAFQIEDALNVSMP